MNVSTIINMLREDPAIADDVPGFLKRMNAKTSRREIVVTRVTETQVLLESIADANGGEATERDVEYALKLIADEVLIDEMESRHRKVVAEIQAGTVRDSAEAISKYSEPVVKESRDAQAAEAALAAEAESK